jgi:hypothetical protein
MLLGSTSLADSPLEAFSTGNIHKGEMRFPLVRGASQQPEVTVPALPGNCERHVDVTLKWDEEEDWVTVRLRGKGVLDQYPTVHRTLGVDYFPNPFWPETKDVVNGVYQFWFVSPAEEHTFYYDGTTLDLLGSDLEFASPPPGSIPIPIPTVKLVGSELFRPDANGDLDVKLTYSYSAMTRGDLPLYAHNITSFPFTNLCKGNRYRFDLSEARGYVSRPRPASEARSFSDYLRNGLFYSITIEPEEYYVFPPVDTQIVTYSQGTIIAGLIPTGYTWDIDAGFMNLAPPVKPFDGHGHCVNWFTGVHTQNINFCGP